MSCSVRKSRIEAALKQYGSILEAALKQQHRSSNDVTYLTKPTLPCLGDYELSHWRRRDEPLAMLGRIVNIGNRNLSYLGIK